MLEAQRLIKIRCYRSTYDVQNLLNAYKMNVMSRAFSAGPDGPRSMQRAVSLQRQLLPLPLHDWRNQHRESDRQRRYRSLICHASTIPKAPEQAANLPWTGGPEQIAALEALKLQTSSLPGAPLDEETLKWFLRDRDFNVEETVSKLRKATKWREKMRPDALSEDDVYVQLSTGKGYVHSHRDRSGRPVLVVRVAKHFASAKGEPQSSQKLCAYLMETALQQLPKDGETVLGIFDFEGAGAQNIDLEFARFLIDMFFSYYPKRLGQVLMVDAPWIFQPPWQVIKPLLRKYASLVRFCNSGNVREEYFTPETCPPAFKR